MGKSAIFNFFSRKTPAFPGWDGGIPGWANEVQIPATLGCQIEIPLLTRPVAVAVSLILVLLYLEERKRA